MLSRCSISIPPENINKFWVSDVLGVRNGILANLDYQQY